MILLRLLRLMCKKCMRQYTRNVSVLISAIEIEKGVQISHCAVP